MSTSTVYDPAMCGSTGIFGTDVDQRRVDLAADLDWNVWPVFVVEIGNHVPEIAWRAAMSWWRCWPRTRSVQTACARWVSARLPVPEPGRMI